MKFPLYHSNLVFFMVSDVMFRKNDTPPPKGKSEQWGHSVDIFFEYVFRERDPRHAVEQLTEQGGDPRVFCPMHPSMKGYRVPSSPKAVITNPFGSLAQLYVLEDFGLRREAPGAFFSGGTMLNWCRSVFVVASSSQQLVIDVFGSWPGLNRRSSLTPGYDIC